MSHIMLVHWNEGECRNRGRKLEEAGHNVTLHWSADDGPSLLKTAKSPPDAFVIDLNRLPSHGRAVGVALRKNAKSRHVPLVFIRGEKEKTAKTRELLPDATFTTWRSLSKSLEKAIAAPPPQSPAVPDTMAGYSGTPLPKKLGIKSHATVGVLSAPAGFDRVLGALPTGVTIRRQTRGQAEVVIQFLRSRAALCERFDKATRMVAVGGRIWLAWPKKTSPLAGDLTQQDIRQYGLDRDWVDFKICAIDKDWSGLCFARRKT